jgi:hypothetical protein
VTRKLTVTYGARWDYATPEREQYGRLGQLDPTLPNANAGGQLGAVQYASACNCNFYKSAYPFALGPRVGAAYQLTPKTVLRGGWGFTYQFVANPAGTTIGTNGVFPLSGINPYVIIATPGSVVQPTWPVTNPYVPIAAKWVTNSAARVSPGDDAQAVIEDTFESFNLMLETQRSVQEKADLVALPPGALASRTRD